MRNVHNLGVRGVGVGNGKQKSRKKKKKQTSANKTSIFSCRKLNYIHQITRKKHTEDGLYMNQN